MNIRIDAIRQALEPFPLTLLWGLWIGLGGVIVGILLLVAVRSRTSAIKSLRLFGLFATPLFLALFVIAVAVMQTTDARAKRLAAILNGGRELNVKGTPKGILVSATLESVSRLQLDKGTTPASYARVQARLSYKELERISLVIPPAKVGAFAEKICLALTDVGP